ADDRLVHPQFPVTLGALDDVRHGVVRNGAETGARTARRRAPRLSPRCQFFPTNWSGTPMHVPHNSRTRKTRPTIRRIQPIFVRPLPDGSISPRSMAFRSVWPK